MKFFKPVHKGRELGKIQAPDCLFCTEGTDPTRNGICGSCVRLFRALLQSPKWSRERLAYLSEFPYCVKCQAGLSHLPGYTGACCLVEATQLDHIKPWRRFPSLFWEPTNWQGLCVPCHNFKTNEEDGGCFKQRA